MFKCLNATKILALLTTNIHLSNIKIVAYEVVLRVIIVITLILYSITEYILG